MSAWATRGNRHRTHRFSLAVTAGEAEMVRGTAEYLEYPSVQAFLMALVLEAAVCLECGEQRDDDRVAAGMKCSHCAYGSSG